MELDALDILKEEQQELRVDLELSEEAAHPVGIVPRRAQLGLDAAQGEAEESAGEGTRVKGKLGGATEAVAVWRGTGRRDAQCRCDGRADATC